jgi:PTS system glucose-specific IIC component
MNIFKASFAYLQKIGKALMLPVSVLPVAGILLGVGSSHFSFLTAVVSDFMAQGGGAIFGNLPLIFAMATAMGLAANDGVAALAATVGYVVMLATLGVMAKVFGVTPKEIMGIKSIDTGVFGGILVGGIAASLFNRYYRIKLPMFLGFFAGKRFVPIVTAFASIGLGLVLSLIWPPVQGVIDTLSHAAAYGSPTSAAAIYGFVERLLLPFGLHHIWNVPFFFEIGSFTDATGKVLHGDTTRFFAGDPTAGILGGGFLFKMWGLPAAGLAMWQCARPENRDKVGSLMISAALTSFLTGITEPLEFSFLFVAPQLYFLHACLVAAAQALLGFLGAHVGYTFSQGFIDYVLYLNLDTKPWLVIVIGPFWALLYYGVFTGMIKAFNLKTPGREIEEIAAGGAESAQGEEKAVELVRALGGRGNIVSLDACITRLRVDLKDVNLANADRLKALGATGVMSVGTGVQAIFGPASENLKSDMEVALRKNIPALETPFGGGSGLAKASAKEMVNVAAKLPKLYPMLGGESNVLSSEGIAGNRVRLTLKDASAMQEAKLKEAGVAAVMRLPGGAVHLLFT